MKLYTENENQKMTLTELKRLNHKIYNSYRAMKQRCYNKNNIKYKDYGERGIKVCNEWLENPYNFYKWAIENGHKDNLTIDRINNYGDYEPSNCRWVDNYTQANNKRNNFNITYNGITKTIHEWSRIYNIGVGTIRYRYTNNWKINDVFNIKPKVGRNQYS